METQSRGIQPHNHDLTTVRSLFDTYQNMRYDVSAKYKNMGIDAILQDVNGSDNLFDDLIKLYEKFNTEVSGVNDSISSQIENFKSLHASTTSYGMVKIGTDTGLKVDDGVLNNEFASAEKYGVVKVDGGHGLTISDDGILNVDFSSTEKYGVVKVGDANSSGLTISGDGVLTTNFNKVQRKLISGTNIKTINGVDIIREDDQVDWDGNLDLVSKSDFNTHKQNWEDTFNTFQGTLISILHEIQTIQNSNGGAGGTTGLINCPIGAPISDTCGDVVLQSKVSYYRKTITQSLDSCVDPSATKYFNIDASSIRTIDDEYMAMRFYLSLETQNDNFVGDVDKLPWTWIGTAPSTDSFSADTVTVVEIFGYWKCNIWNFRGKVVDQYTIVCND